MYDFIPFVGDPLKQKENSSEVIFSSFKCLTMCEHCDINIVPAIFP